MSRCFPFPPPGYEKKTRTGDLDSLLKEKHKEKKQKKEKKDREKKESKDKKVKDRSKEKHRDKDRKDKQKDKKRDKDKDRHKTADEQRSEERKADDTPGKLVERNHAVQEKKFADEFIRRIRDDGKKAEEMVGHFNGVQQRQVDGTVRTKDIELKGKNRENRIEGAEMPKGIENKEKNKGRRTEVIGWSKEDIGDKAKNKERQTDGIDKPSQEVVVKDKRKERQPEAIDKSKEYIVGKDYDNERQALGIHRPKEDIVSSKKVKEKQIEGTDRPKPDVISKDKAKEMQTKGIERPKADITGKEKAKQMYIGGINGPKEVVMGRGENKEKEVNTKKAKHKDKAQGREEKSKSKDKKKDEEEEKKVERIAHKQIEQILGESGNKLQSGTFSVAAVYLGKDITNNAGQDPNTRKRKDLERNGVFHDELRPNKLPRAASGATLQLENGCRLETVHNALQRTPDRLGEADNRKLERVADGNSPYNKDRKINGKLEPRLSSVNLRPCAATVVDTSISGREPIRPPHPDSQYLDQILTVPKVPEWSDFDDQEWLFSDNNIQTKPSFQSEIDGTPQVWAETLHIEPADVHALPYVIPY
ncbi:hypothetical protein EJ110_NYTH08138 [Nymphaea thermarum]|nr:hypothetical protein EJ110_NYTH08138 [Nymphaea thermarum]